MEASLLQRLSAILPKEEDFKIQKALDFYKWKITTRPFHY